MNSLPKTEIPAEAAMAHALDHLWRRFLPEIRERVSVLEIAAAAVAANNLSPSDREAAQAAAHKLAGVLGTFNLARGTELARELELAYSRDSVPPASSGKRLTSLAAELHRLIDSRQSG